MLAPRKLLLTFLLMGVSLSLTGRSHGQRVLKEHFDPDGSFWIRGTPPPEFKDFGGINLNSKRLRRLPAAGVDLVQGTRMPFRLLTVKRQTLVFKTTTVRGISYGFSGYFLKDGVFSAGNLDPDAAVLEGTLTKWRAGRKVAEANLRFTYFGGT